jgi:hypothetical protein
MARHEILQMPAQMLDLALVQRDHLGQCGVGIVEGMAWREGGFCHGPFSRCAQPAEGTGTAGKFA